MPSCNAALPHAARVAQRAARHAPPAVSACAGSGVLTHTSTHTVLALQELWTSLLLEGRAAREFEEFKVDETLLAGKIADFKVAYKSFKPQLDRVDTDVMKVFLAGDTEPDAAEISEVVGRRRVPSSDPLATILAKPETGLKRVYLVITAPAAGAPGLQRPTTDAWRARSTAPRRGPPRLACVSRARGGRREARSCSHVCWCGGARARAPTARGAACGGTRARRLRAERALAARCQCAGRGV